MYEYANYCPVAATTSVIGDYWSPLILRELLYGTNRFNQLARNLPSISRSLLASRLQKFEREGVIECERPGRNSSTYSVTPAGRALEPVIEAMSQWGTTWAAKLNEDGQPEPFLTICMLKDRVRTGELPAERLAIEVLATSPDGDACGWLLCEAGGIAMCFEPPGLEMDLYVWAPSSVLYDIWLVRTTMARAFERGDVTVEGPGELVRGFVSWFEGSLAAR